jgi:hypothetical protein
VNPRRPSKSFDFPTLFVGAQGCTSATPAPRASLLGARTRGMSVGTDLGRRHSRSTCASNLRRLTADLGEPLREGGPIFLVELLTSMEVPLDSPPSTAGLEIIDTTVRPATFRRLPAAPPALAVATALSERMVVRSRHGHVATEVVFTRGILAAGPIERQTPHRDGVEFVMTPDGEIMRAAFGFEVSPKCYETSRSDDACRSSFAMSGGTCCSRPVLAKVVAANLVLTYAGSQAAERPHRCRRFS